MHVAVARREKTRRGQHATGLWQMRITDVGGSPGSREPLDWEAIGWFALLLAKVIALHDLNTSRAFALKVFPG